jgi:membrane-bound serine protease (ClpP class)
VGLGSLLSVMARPIAAEPAMVRQATPADHVDVIQVSGLIDPIQADFISHSVAGANHDGALVLVVQLNSGGGLIGSAGMDRLVATVARSPVPVAVWVGPNGSRARGAAFSIFMAATLRGTAPGTHLGGPPPTGLLDAPTLGDFLVGLDHQTLPDGRVLHTAEVVREPGQQPRRRPTVITRFKKVGLLAELLHTAASPSVAYLLGVIGLLLVVLEFFTAGIGIAAVAGAGSLVLASYGLGVLPVRPYALVLIVLGIFGYAIDLQAGVPRVWTVIGTGALVVGTVRLYADRGGVHLSPLAMVAGVAGTALFMLAGMPSMIRARFSTPTIGRESMIGEVGTALGAIGPEGTVEVRGAPWRARTNRATPIEAGAPIRVVSIEGLLLEVEPEEGGARPAGH